MSNQRLGAWIRKWGGVAVALMALAIWANGTPAIASPPLGTPGTPSLFTNKVVQPIGIAADQCLVYEDTDPGIEAARRANMQWIDVRTFYTPRRISRQ